MNIQEPINSTFCASIPTIFELRERRKHFTYGDELELHTVELVKLLNGAREEDELLYRWAKIIIAKSREEINMVEKDPYIEAALEELEKISNDPVKRAEYNYRDRVLRDYVTQMNGERKAGKAEGASETQRKMVKALLKQNINVEVIMKASELSEQEIEAIRTDMKE